MRYPFATILVTIAIFAFMTLVITSGELKIGNSKEIIAKITITQAQAKCANSKKRASTIDFSELQNSCKGQSFCNVNSSQLLQANNWQGKPNCITELKINYKCDAVNNVAYLYGDNYSGQKAELACMSGS